MTINSTSAKHAVRVIAAVATMSAFSMTVSGCGLFHPDDYPTSGPTMSATSNPQDVSSADFGHSWGLTVDHGTVSCTMNAAGDPVLRFADPDGTEYALNSVDDNSDLPDIGEIEDGSVGTLRTFAFTVCSG